MTPLVERDEGRVEGHSVLSEEPLDWPVVDDKKKKEYVCCIQIVKNSIQDSRLPKDFIKKKLHRGMVRR